MVCAINNIIMRNIFLLLFVSFALSICGQSQPFTTNRCDSVFYTSTNQAWFGDVVASGTNAVTVAGTSNYLSGSSGDVLLNNYDLNLNPVWTKTLYAGGSFDIAYGLTSLSTGGYLIHNSFGASNASGFYSAGYLIKTDAVGNQSWVRTLTGTTYGDNYASHAAENSTGEIVSYGHVQYHTGCTSYATRITKTSAAGTNIWSYCLQLNPDLNGGFDKLAASNEYISAYNNNGSLELRKFNDNGTLLNTVAYKYQSVYNTYSSRVKRCSSGGFFICGRVDSASTNNFFYAKFDNNMNFVWGKTYNKSATENFSGVFESSTNLFFVGESNLDAILFKTDLNGNFINGKVFGDVSNPERFTSVIQTTSGDLFCSGFKGNKGIIIKYCDMACVAPLNPINATSLQNQTVCANASASLSASGSGTLSWFSTNNSTLTLGSGTLFITPVLTAGSYTYYVQAFTCASSASRTAVTLTVNGLPNVSISSPTVVCNGDIVTLNALGASTYTWSNSSNSASITISPTVTTSYSVTGANNNGCGSSASKTITVNSLPIINTTSTSSLVCVGQSATLSATGANSYTWTNNTVATNIVISPSVTTSYSVSGSNSNGCVNNAVHTQSVSACTEIEEHMHNNNFVCFPNPANSLITISFSTKPNHLARLELVNSQGQVLITKTEDVNDGEINIDISELSSGFYFLKVGYVVHKIQIVK